MDLDAVGYQVRTATGHEYFCLATIRPSRTQAKQALKSINQSMSNKKRPVLEIVELKKVRVVLEGAP